MAIKGLTTLITADYKCTNGAVTYENMAENQEMVSYSVEVESTEKSVLYANNREKEIENGVFKSGTLTVGTDDLSQETSQSFYKVKTKEVTIGTGENAPKVTELTYDDEAKSVEKGVGVIECHQIDNEDMYRAVILPRVVFDVPKNSANTRGESIEWQTPELTGTIMRSGQVDTNGKHPWKMEADCDTFEDAVNYIKQKLGPAAGA